MKTMQTIRFVCLFFFLICLIFNFNQGNANQDSKYTISKNDDGQNSTTIPFWILCDLDFILLIGFGTMILSVVGGIKAILVMSCCVSTCVIMSSFEPLLGALNSNYINSSDGMVNLFSVLKDIASSSSLLEVQKQIVIIECVASILLCLVQISLSIIILSEENHMQIVTRTWLILQIPATFFTLYTIIISNKCWMNNYNMEYERFRRSVLSYLLFIYFALPSLVFLETDRRLIIYKSSQEFRV